MRSSALPSSCATEDSIIYKYIAEYNQKQSTIEVKISYDSKYCVRSTGTLVHVCASRSTFLVALLQQIHYSLLVIDNVLGMVNGNISARPFLNFQVNVRSVQQVVNLFIIDFYIANPVIFSNFIGYNRLVFMQYLNRNCLLSADSISLKISRIANMVMPGWLASPHMVCVFPVKQ